MTTIHFAQLADDDLIARTVGAAANERRATVELLQLLIEIDQRRLYLRRGYSSLFTFCTGVLRLSEQAAYARITAARASRRFPALLAALASGDLTLSGIGRLAPQLSDDNADALLDAARGKSTREVERLVASLYPEPVIETTIRALPSRALPIEQAAESPSAPLLVDPAASGSSCEQVRAIPPRPVCPPAAPIGSRHFLLKVTISEATHQKLERLRALMRHTLPAADPAEIVDRALTLLLEQVERQKAATLRRPQLRGDRKAPAREPLGRRISAAVRRAVWQRDGGRCAFVGTQHRCGESAFLEFHHVVPFAAGGKATLENIELRCRAHNAYEAAVFFGDQSIDFGRDS